MPRSNKQRCQVLTPQAVFVILVGPLDVAMVYLTGGWWVCLSNNVPLFTIVVDGVCVKSV